MPREYWPTWSRCWRCMNPTGGENWANGSNWLTLSPVGEWHGVTVGAGGLVTELELSDNGLNGELPPQLGSLANLQHLGLGRNQLTGSIPPQLGDLNKLEVLGIAGNKLTGAIPPELGGLANLTDLMLDVNGLSGSIPAELGNLANLKELWLNENQLSGVVPAELGQLSNLTTLRIDNNNLEGELPSELGNLANLEQASIWGNDLTWGENYGDGILADIVALVALYDSTDGENWAKSSKWLTFAPADEWHGVTTSADGLVTELDLQKNDLGGKLPPQLGNLLNLRKLDLGVNQLSGEIPAELGRLASLTYLNLGTNQLSGKIPSELGNLTNLTNLYLDTNGLSEIPAELGNLSSLEELYLQDNELSGQVPPELGNLTGLTLLYLADNQLIGELPTQLGQLSNLQQVSVWDNQLTWANHYESGILADTVALVALYESTNGQEWRTWYHFSDWRGTRYYDFNWLKYEPLGEWTKVTTFGGRVTELDFSYGNRVRKGSMSGEDSLGTGESNRLAKVKSVRSGQPDRLHPLQLARHRIRGRPALLLGSPLPPPSPTGERKPLLDGGR